MRLVPELGGSLLDGLERLVGNFRELCGRGGNVDLCDAWGRNVRSSNLGSSDLGSRDLGSSLLNALRNASRDRGDFTRGTRKSARDESWLVGRARELWWASYFRQCRRMTRLVAGLPVADLVQGLASGARRGRSEELGRRALALDGGAAAIVLAENALFGEGGLVGFERPFQSGDQVVFQERVGAGGQAVLAEAHDASMGRAAHSGILAR